LGKLIHKKRISPSANAKGLIIVWLPPLLEGFRTFKGDMMVIENIKINKLILRY